MSDIEELLTGIGVSYQTSGPNTSRDFVNVSCTFCDDGGYHLGINRTDYWFKCLRCDAKGSWWKLATKMRERYPSPLWDTIKPNGQTLWLDTPKVITKPKTDMEFRELNEIDDSQFFDWLCVAPEQEAFADECRPRGLDYEIVRATRPKLGLKAFSGYLIWECSSGVIGRKYTKQVFGPKWRGDGLSTKSIYGTDWVRKIQPKKAYITEGVMDCLRFPLGESLAILGITASDEKMAKVAEALDGTENIFLAFDRGVPDSIWEAWTLTLTDFGFTVDSIDWAQVPSSVKDVDEFRLRFGQKSFESLVGLHRLENFL